MRPEMRFTPPRRARRRIAGLVMPWMLSLSTFRWRLAPPFPSPLPPLPLPDMTNTTREHKPQCQCGQLGPLIYETIGPDWKPQAHGREAVEMVPAPPQFLLSLLTCPIHSPPHTPPSSGPCLPQPGPKPGLPNSAAVFLRFSPSGCSRETLNSGE